MSSASFQERFKGKTSLIPKEGVDAVIKDSDNPIMKPYDSSINIQYHQRMMQLPEFTAHQRYANQKREAHTFDQIRPFFSPDKISNNTTNIYSATYNKQQNQSSDHRVLLQQSKNFQQVNGVSQSIPSAPARINGNTVAIAGTKNSIDSIDRQMQAMAVQKHNQQQQQQVKQQQQQSFEMLAKSPYMDAKKGIISSSSSVKSFTPLSGAVSPTMMMMRDMNPFSSQSQQQLQQQRQFMLPPQMLNNNNNNNSKVNTKANNGYNVIYSTPQLNARNTKGNAQIPDDYESIMLTYMQQQQLNSNDDQDAYSAAGGDSSNIINNRYRPYTLNEYKNLQKGANFKLGGLGPNTGNEDWKSKKDQLDKRVEFAKQIQSINSQILKQQQEEGRIVQSKLTKEISARERALEFAKNIKKNQGSMQEIPSQQSENTKQQHLQSADFDAHEKKHLDFLNKIESFSKS